MAGHSHWSQIKRKKAATDAKRGAAFSKAAKAITVAARQAGGDPSMNLSLRYAIDAARAINMPRDNIRRALQKGTGELDGGADIETLLYEAYAPGGVAVMIECLTDNRNRTASEVRNIIEKNGGTLAATNAVAHMFQRKGVFTVPAAAADEDAVMEVALDAGADDVVTGDGFYEVTCTPEAFEAVGAAFEKAEIKTDAAKVEPVPHTTVPLDADTGRKVLRLMNLLDEQEDVNEVYANFDISDEVMVEIGDA
jgi:YebC/PmpR family DNA-binding regulatory protein